MRLEPAGLALLWRHLELKNVPVLEHEYRALVAEALAGGLWAGVDGADPVAVGGVLLQGAALPGTAWLSIVPGLAPRQVLRAALLMRRVIAATAGVHGPGVVCCIGVDNQGGARLGRALGFRATALRVGDLREWRLAWAGSST